MLPKDLLLGDQLIPKQINLFCSIGLVDDRCLQGPGVLPQVGSWCQLPKEAQYAAVEIPPHHSVRMPESASQIVLNADLDRLSRAFAHLIGNALRYWPDGGEVVVEASSTEKRVNVAIVDRGPGIPEDATGDLFSPFHHARRGNAVAGQGLGLGLSLTKRIVEAHGGQIAVEKTPGGGTTVRLWLPVG